MRAPNPMQQFRLWRDFGGPKTGPLNLLRWNEFTDERRAAYINHALIGAIEGLCFAIAFVVMSLAGVASGRAYIMLFAAFLAVGAVHLLVMLVRRETYLQLKWREIQSNKQKSEANFQELKAYANKVEKGFIK